MNRLHFTGKGTSGRCRCINSGVPDRSSSGTALGVTRLRSAGHRRGPRKGVDTALLLFGNLRGQGKIENILILNNKKKN